jgi:hypothetical protein
MLDPRINKDVELPGQDAAILPNGSSPVLFWYLYPEFWYSAAPLFLVILLHHFSAFLGTAASFSTHSASLGTLLQG